MPRRRWWCLLNPPTDFIAHDAEVRKHVEGLRAELVELRYGYGPSAELELEVEDDADVVALLESLRVDLKMTALDPVCALTARERQDLAPDVPPAVAFPSDEPPSGGA
jgi:hypothetical protein